MDKAWSFLFKCLNCYFFCFCAVGPYSSVTITTTVFTYYFHCFVLTIGTILSFFIFFIKSNKKDVTIYETTQLKKETIQTKIVATGKVIPEDEVEIKPQIAGIIDKILVKEGDQVKAGDLLVKIKVVPNEQTLNSAEGRVKSAKIILANSETEFTRNKKLFSNY